MSLRNVFRILAGLAMANIVAGIIFRQDIMSLIISNSNRRVAVYSQFSFHGYPEFVKVRVDSSIADAKLYVEIPSGERFLLRDLPEEAIKPYLEHHDFRKSPIRPENADAYRLGSNMLVYRDGKLTYAVFHFPKELFRFSPKKEGPYLLLPAELGDLERAFGKPLRWERPGSLGPRGR